MIFIFKICNLWKFSQTDYEWAIKLNRISLQVLGLWPETEQIPGEKLKNNLRVLASIVFLIFGIIVPYTQSLMNIHKEIVLVIEHVRFIMPIVTCVSRIFILWWKKEGNYLGTIKQKK